MFSWHGLCRWDWASRGVKMGLGCHVLEDGFLQSTGNGLFISGFIQIKGCVMGMTSQFECDHLAALFHPCWGPVSPATLAWTLCTRLPQLPLIHHTVDRQSDVWEIPTSCRGASHTQTHSYTCIIFPRSSLVSVIWPSSLTRRRDIAVAFWHLPVSLHSSRVGA